MEFDDEMEIWLKGEAQNLEALADSAIFTGLVTENYLQDPQCMLQIGAALCLGKPILLIMMDGCKCPDKLFQVADKVVFATKDNFKEKMDEIGEAIKSMAEGEE